MCKRHWKAVNFPEEASKKSGSTPPEPMVRSKEGSLLPFARTIMKLTIGCLLNFIVSFKGESVYDSILPMSIAYRPMQAKAPSEDIAGKHDLLDPPGRSHLK